jgi:AraC family transcriptional regulator
MNFRFETIAEKHLVGFSDRFSMNDQRIPQLWQKLMPRRGEIQGVLSSDLFSIEEYDDLSFFQAFNPTKEFKKWAAVEVDHTADNPDDFERLSIPSGDYVVFTFVGPPSEAFKAYSFVFQSWIPSSGFDVDLRPHFAIMGAKYKLNDNSSEEEIWIPIKKKH